MALTLVVYESKSRKPKRQKPLRLELKSLKLNDIESCVLKSKRNTLLNDMWICRLSLSEARLYHVLGFSLQGSLEAVKRMRNSRELLGNFWVRY